MVYNIMVYNNKTILAITILSKKIYFRWKCCNNE